jgi:hypothetical protein
MNQLMKLLLNSAANFLTIIILLMYMILIFVLNNLEAKTDSKFEPVQWWASEAIRFLNQTISLNQQRDVTAIIIINIIII